MVTRILPNKYIARVHEGDVMADELGLLGTDIKQMGLKIFDKVLVSVFDDRKPYFMRVQCELVMLKKKSHLSYEKARKGFAVISPQLMKQLQLEIRDGIIIDPVTPSYISRETLRQAWEYFKN